MRELLKGPHWLLGNRNFKYLDRQARAIKYALRDNRNLASIYKDLAKKKTSKKGKEKEEAIYLITQLNEYLQEQKKKMHRLSKTEPEEYWKVFKKFYRLFRGVDVAADAFQTHERVRKDPGFQKLTKAEKLWNTMLRYRYELRPVKYGQDLKPGDPKFFRKNARAIYGIRRCFRYFEKNYKETLYFQESRRTQEFRGRNE